MKDEKRAEAEAAMPIPMGDLKDLFDWLDKKSIDECDHSNKFTVEFLRERKLPEEPIVKWLAENGGYCDCEVLANVEDEWG